MREREQKKFLCWSHTTIIIFVIIIIDYFCVLVLHYYCFLNMNVCGVFVTCNGCIYVLWLSWSHYLECFNLNFKGAWMCMWKWWIFEMRWMCEYLMVYTKFVNASLSQCGILCKFIRWPVLLIKYHTKVNLQIFNVFLCFCGPPNFNIGVTKNLI